MNNAIQPVQGPNAQPATQQAAPPKNQQATAQNAAPQDKVTISQQAQALASKAKPSGDVDHDGDSH